MFEENVILAPYTNYKIGGPARFFFTAKNAEELTQAITKAKAENLKFFILGGATNVLFSDEGFDGLVIKLELNKIKLEAGEKVRVGASTPVKTLLEFLIENSLSGFEWAGGLPGTIGGAIYGNAGAFGGETKDNITEVVSINVKTGQSENRNNADCHFGYRMSIFKERAFKDQDANAPSYVPPKDVIVEAVFQFARGNQESIQASAQEKINYRNERQPIEYPNIGSIHKNVDLKKVPKEVAKKYASQIKVDPFPVMPTALLISEAGLKGKTIGQAQVSEKHPNFIINLGGAKASDVHDLAQLVKDTIKEKFNIELEREVIFL